MFGGVGCEDFCSLRGLGCGYCSSRRCRMWLLLLMEVWVVATLSLGGFGEWLILFS